MSCQSPGGTGSDRPAGRVSPANAPRSSTGCVPWQGRVPPRFASSHTKPRILWGMQVFNHYLLTDGPRLRCQTQTHTPFPRSDR